ncbi:MAG TPA: serine hydrolase [Dermatophilaceae bacterium]|nr:serine hydrolase [Dermatophilaceae bacterium]
MTTVPGSPSAERTGRHRGGRPQSGVHRRDPIVRAASISKPITAALTLALVDDGLLGLDDPVGDLLPEIASPQVLGTTSADLDDTVPAIRPITTRHLLTFTAGHGFPADFEHPVARRLAEGQGQGPPQPQHVPAPEEWMRRPTTDCRVTPSPCWTSLAGSGRPPPAFPSGAGGLVTTAAYVDPGAGTVTVVLSQVELGGPGSDALLAEVLTAAASVAARSDPTGKPVGPS